MLHRGQRGGEQGGAVRPRPARFEPGRRHHVADAQRRQPPATPARWCRPRPRFAQRVLAEAFGDAHEMQRLEHPVLQRGVGCGTGLRGQQIEQGVAGVLQGGGPVVRQAVGQRLRALGRREFAGEGAPAPVQGVHGFADVRGRLVPLAQELVRVQCGAVHAARAVDQVVRLVHQQRGAPALVFGQCEPVRAHIEPVVVVAHQHVAPALHLLAEVVGADAVCQRQCAQAVPVQPGGLRRRLARGGQAVVEASRQRAGLAVAGLVRVLAGLVARQAFEYPQRQARGSAQPLQRVQRQLPAGGAGGEEEQAVGALVGHGAQAGEHRGHGLADAGGGLGQQVARAGVGAVHIGRQFALPGAERGKGKRKRRQGLVPCMPVQLIGPGPGEVPLAQVLEEVPQRIGGAGLGQHRFLPAVDVEIDQGHLDLRQ